MMDSFKIVEHTIAGQHIREHPHSVRGRQEDVLQLAIKQYIPLGDAHSIPDNAVTVIGVHGNGTPKELFEPFWEHLYAHLKRCSVPLRAIWIADVSNQGASGVLNEAVQGDTTPWYDHSRDLLHMVNHFRDEMPRPMIGVAHSMGCNQLFVTTSTPRNLTILLLIIPFRVHLSILHPRLLSTLILYEPIIFETGWGPMNPAKLVSRRQDLWETREKAETALRKMFQKWNPRVVDRLVQFGIRPLPTKLYNKNINPNLPTSAVTLTTTRHQESWSYTIPNLEPESAGLDRLLLPDWDTETERPYKFGRPEVWSCMRNLPFVRPSVLLAFGSRSYLSPPDERAAKLRKTGIGAGGSGGAAQGMVEQHVFEGASHTLVFEQIDESTDVAADWIRRWFQGWLADENILAEYQSKRSVMDMTKASEASVQTSLVQTGTKRPNAKL
ncbi:toxin biosynthesis protein [Penicillium waksmanii]|uniref:toxin biosynthesis protein n=1 Tax=Penicillium waksmanii TaxID=69791 RepID=UPI0025472571|nr:toxin biosynthesis protein [Penicillium waksmanii]KAJ5979562.1 toxin biosynthesis protein [Penicillium waksmanii]